MKEFLKSAFSNAVIFSETVISVLSVFFFSSFFGKKNLKEIPKNGNDKCFIITNGSSLRKVLENEKEIFIDQDVFTVNLFYQTSYFFEMKPSNHVITDNAFWDPPADERIEGIQKRFKEQLLKVTWEMNLFVPAHGIEIIKTILSLNKNITLIPYNMTPVSGIKSISHFLYRHNLGMPKPTNVLNAAIFLTLNMGYKTIYIYGADHSWIQDLFVDEDNDVCCFENHFYDNTRKPYKMPKGSLAEGLKSIVEAFESYKLLDIYSKTINARIINKTKGSFIDVFDHS
jgi:hypothetical protein